MKKAILFVLFSILLVGCNEKLSLSDTDSISSEFSLQKEKDAPQIKSTENKNTAFITQKKDLSGFYKVIHYDLKKATKITLTQEESKNLNIFFSNFSELNFPSFSQETLSDDLLIYFGFFHNYKNNPIKFKTIDTNRFLHKNDMDMTVLKYFNRKIKNHKTISYGSVSLPYNNSMNAYYFPIVSGEPFRFTYVDDLFDIKNGEYIAILTHFSASPGFIFPEEPYNFIPKEILKYSEVKISGQGKALIKKINSDNKERYVLVEYLR